MDGMEVLLTTDRLRLRRLLASDLDHLVALDGDPEVMRYLSGGAPTPREVVAERVLPGFLQRDRRRPHLGVWAIELLEAEASVGGQAAEPAFLGWISLLPHHSDDPTQLRLGYRLRRAAWGRGYATEAARSLLEVGFGEEGDLQRVEATTYELNLASQRVLEKLGLRLQRRYRPTAEELAASSSFGGDAEVWDGDELVYGIDRAGWRSRAD